MSDIWVASIDYSGFAATLGTDGNPDANAYQYAIEFHVIAIPPGSRLPRYNWTPDYGHFACVLRVLADGSTAMLLQIQKNDSEVKPTAWGTFFEVGSIFSDYATLAAGGTITFTKDSASDLLTVASPLGTLTLTLSHLDPFLSGGPSYLNNYPLVPQGYGAEFTLANPTFSFPAYPLVHITKWSNIVAKQNGTPYQTYPLSAASPSTYYSDTGIAFLPGFGSVSGVISPFWTSTQETSDNKIKAEVTILDFPSYRLFDFWRNLRDPTPPSGPDSCLIVDHGPIATAYIDPTNVENVLYRIDTGDGSNVLTGAIAAIGGSSNASPSINWTADRLRAVWHDGTNIVQSYTYNFGATWSTPMALSITGTNPAVLVSADHGLSWFFYYDGSDIKVVGSGDYGANLGTPVTVVTAADAQTIAAVIASDGTLIVTYFSGSTIVQKKSRDLGQTWG